LTVTTEVRNNSEEEVTGTLTGQIDDIRFTREVTIGPGESSTVAFSHEAYEQLTLGNPRIWWPVQLGPQHLYELRLAFHWEAEVSDRQTVRFGIREASSEINEHGHRVFKMNGRNILIKGAGWTPDMMLRSSPEREEREIRYVKDLNLNAIRLEGKLGTDHLWDLCDRYGILVLAGWCCCAHWEQWHAWDAEDLEVARASLEDQVLRLRNRPSLISWMNGSDFHPPPVVEEMYLEVLDRYRWPTPVLSSATEDSSTVTGDTGVKMTGPYEYVPPVYWTSDTRNGGAFGFNTETSPGPVIPPVESLRKMLPEDHLWPIDHVWNYHAGGGLFQNLSIFTRALNKRYGTATGLEDYVKKAQAMNYEAQRAMFEAYRARKYRATGLIQWMLNDAWPSLIWHLYDYYLRPAGGYFGTKRACEPLREIPRGGSRGCASGQQQQDLLHPCDPGPEPNLFPQAHPAGQNGQGLEPQSLLALHKTRRTRLGPCQLVLHTASAVRRPEGAG
jgi:exo-1,4-beta-D-glucosaminidase